MLVYTLQKKKSNGGMHMNKVILKEILNQCNWYERLRVKTCKKISIKIYRLGVKTGFNWQNMNKEKVSH